MHRVLYLQEILLEIFDQCYNVQVEVGRRRVGLKNLGALARTCKAFEEPALDILWAELEDLTPLVRCLPEASWMNEDGLCSLKRSLGTADWNIILGFTHRVRGCRLEGSFGLAADCVEGLSKPPASTALVFPNLCDVRLYGLGDDTVDLLRHLTGPRLSVLFLHFTEDIRDAIETFLGNCSNIRSFCYASPLPGNKDGTISHLICQWPKLYFVMCHDIVLNAAALRHLSHIPSLRFLSFKLSETDCIEPTPSGALNITLPALVRWELQSPCLENVWKFFHGLRLPTIEEVILALDIHPTGLELKSFIATLPGTCNHQSLITVMFSVFELRPQLVVDPPADCISFHHLHPLTVFVNIRTIFLESAGKIDINEKELLLLASSWPHLKEFCVGWGEYKNIGPSAITPGGFVQLLERCRSLSRLSFPFDTHGYTEIPRGHPWHGLAMPKNALVDVRLSSIEEESVEALGVFFHVAPFPAFFLMNCWHNYSYDDGIDEESRELCRLYDDRWRRVRDLARDLWEERDSLLHLLKTRAGAAVDQDDDGYDSED